MSLKLYSSCAEFNVNSFLDAPYARLEMTKPRPFGTCFFCRRSALASWATRCLCCSSKSLLSCLMRDSTGCSSRDGGDDFSTNEPTAATTWKWIMTGKDLLMRFYYGKVFYLFIYFFKQVVCFLACLPSPSNMEWNNISVLVHVVRRHTWTVSSRFVRFGCACWRFRGVKSRKRSFGRPRLLLEQTVSWMLMTLQKPIGGETTISH